MTIRAKGLNIPLIDVVTNRASSISLFLKDKGFVTAEKIGKGQLFKATVSRNDYTRSYMREVKNTFFGGSVSSLVSFFAKNEELSQQEIDEIMEIINNQKSK